MTTKSNNGEQSREESRAQIIPHGSMRQKMTNESIRSYFLEKTQVNIIVHENKLYGTVNYPMSE